MAQTDRFMIAPINSGLQNSLKPWLVPDDAFQVLTNAYVFRGRVKKRFGSYLMNQLVSSSVAQLYSRLRINLGNTDGAGNKSSTVPGSKFNEGQLFSIGDQMLTVYQLGTPAAMKSTGSATGTYNTTTGAYVITGADAATPVYFYPAEPVMGLVTYTDGTLNAEPIFGFDTQFAYQYVAGAWRRLSAEASAGDALWTGSDYQFFWGATYDGITAADYYMFVTNFNAADHLRYWDGAQWNTLNPDFNAGGDTIETSRIVVAFKDRVVLLNTIEKISGSNTSFVNRCRFSQNGSPVASDAWREDIPGKGGYIDAPTKEQIITSGFLKDRLIVYFESSTWELVYTGNEILPFRWQQINTELGAHATFSVVPFDKVTIAVGNVGIHACNGSNVERIDDKIPDDVFSIQLTDNGDLRVFGIRDYFSELIYWAIVSPGQGSTYPNRVLVYNYKNGSWAYNEDSITAFGYYQEQPDITWAGFQQTWEESDMIWASGLLLSKVQQIIAGNQEGFVFIVSDDFTRNSPALQITNMTVASNVITIKAINHNLSIDQYVAIENAQGITAFNDKIFPIYNVDGTDAFTIHLDYIPSVGTYTGGGTVALVSNYNIQTKQYNFYVDQGVNAMINKVDFLVDKTTDGEVTVDWWISSSTQSQLQAGANTGALIGNGILETSPYTLAPQETIQQRLWHPIYPMANGESIQLHIFMTPSQITNPDISWSDFQLHAMTFYTSPTGRLQ